MSELPSPAASPQVFKKAYIPRTLTEVSHYERDVDAMKESSAVSEHSDSVRTPEEPPSSQDSNVDRTQITTTFPRFCIKL